MIWDWGSTSSGPPIHSRFLQWSRCVLKSPWLCRLGDASYVMCTALYMMVLYDRARVGPTTKTSNEISIICLFRLILQAKSFVLFYLWYSSCFKVKCWIHTFPKRCFHIAMWILILLDHRGRHVNSFSTGALLLEMIPPFSPSARSILSFLNGIHSTCPKLPLFFPPSHPFSSRTQTS